MIEPFARVQGGRDRRSVAGVFIATWDRLVSSEVITRRPSVDANSSYKEHDVRKGEQTRKEIIRKAAPIFNQKGYDGAALSDLMRATGLEKGGIYRHFESKQELAGDRLEGRLVVSVLAAMQRGGGQSWWLMQDGRRLPEKGDIDCQYAER